MAKLEPTTETAAGNAAGPPVSGAAVLNPTDTFVRRHLGPSEGEVREMLAAVGAGSLGELVRETVPASILRGAPWISPGCRPTASSASRRCSPSCAGSRRRTRSSAPISAWATRLHHAAGDPAQHPREPGLVHAVHALPGRDRAGPPRGAAQLPDDGDATSPACRSPTPRCSTRRPPPPRRCTCCTARRGDGKRQRVLRRRALPSADDRRRARRAPSRSASRSSSGDRRRVRLRGERPLRRAAAVPCDRRRAWSTIAPLIEQAHAAGALVVVAADLLALDAADAAGRARAPTSRRQRAALRRAARLRRPARRVLRDPRGARRASSRAASSACREDAHGKPRPAHGAADPRAAHPPREGDQQHLHRAGAARHHGQHVRRLSRARGPPRDRRARARPDGRRSPRGLRAARLQGAPRRFFDTRARRAAAAPSVEAWPPRAAARGSTCAASTSARRHRARRDDDRRRRDDAARRCFAAASRPPRSLAEVADRRRPPPRERAARTSAYLTHPVFNTHHSETEMLRYMRAARGARPVARRTR